MFVVGCEVAGCAPARGPDDARFDQVPQAALAAAFQPFTNIQGAPQLSAKYQRLQQQFAAMNKVQPADMRLTRLITGVPDTATGSVLLTVAVKSQDCQKSRLACLLADNLHRGAGARKPV